MLMKADPSWCLFLERIHSTSLDGEFTAIEFELAFAINIRATLRLVDFNEEEFDRCPWICDGDQGISAKVKK